MKRRRTAAAVALAMDHGSTGPAMLARPSRMVETIVAGVTARQTVDNHLIDRMARAAQLTDRQYEAAQRLLEMAGAAGILLGTTAGWAGGGRQEMSDEMAEAHRRWWVMTKWLGSQKADLITSLMHERHPGVRWLGTVQQALSDLAGKWGMEG